MNGKIKNVIVVRLCPESLHVLRHVTGRLPEFKRRGGVSRAVRRSIIDRWGPLVDQARVTYLRRKTKEGVGV